MDDVDYLVEDNAMDDFCLSSEMDGTHGKSTFEDDPEQQLLRCRLKMQMLGMILVTGEELNSRE